MRACDHDASVHRLTQHGAHRSRFAGVIMTLFMPAFGIALNIVELNKAWVLYLMCIPVVAAAGERAPAAIFAVRRRRPR